MNSSRTARRPRSRQRGWTLFLVLVTAIPAGAARAQDWPRALDSALARIDLTRATARFDLDAVAQWGGDRYSNPRFRRVHNDPWLLPQTIRNETRAVSEAGASLFELLRLATLRTGDGVQRGLIDDPVQRYRARVDSSATPLLDALRSLYDEAVVQFLPSQEATLRKESGKLAPGTEALLAAFTWACADWLKWRKLALRKVSSPDAGLRKLLPLRDPGLNGIFRMETEKHDPDSVDDYEFAQLYDFIEAIDLSYIYAGGLDLAATCEFVADSAANLPQLTRGDFVWDTPLGRIAVGDTTADEYSAQKKYLLILDEGGDDTYRTGGGSVNLSYHTGVIIDLWGNDTYVVDSALKVGFGGAVLGAGYVFDLEGDDTYDGGSISLGAGVFGLGGVMDRAGNDHYRGYISSQGAGLYGVGVLADLAGDDTYYGANQIQGFGFVRGCGILFDHSGNDVYTADDSILTFASPQTPEHNASLAQGVGFGLRADYLHGHSLAGGIGYLVDASGDDRYKAGLFAQGCAYWYALGMLSDGGGRDTYDGVWYVQGSGAHFAVGALYDAEGNDIYTATLNMAQGAGHDFTTGLLWDEAGNDTYHAPNLSLGAGNANGIGIFRDDSGADTYDVSAETTLGRANSEAPGSLRFDLSCLGLFLDFGGQDAYPAAIDAARNGAMWSRPAPQENASPFARGIALDRP